MKKILAILLAVLLLGSVSAFAEAATVYSVSDPVFSFNAGEDQMNLDLKGLSIAFASVSDAAEPTVAVNILGNGEVLFACTLKV